jgi:pseudaminic acid synthase
MGNTQLILLKCTSSYPARIEDANLTVIPEISKEFNVFSGLSDHTIGSTTAIVATVLGARVIEKHFILDRSIGGPDASFSMDESEFSEMVKLIRDAENSLGKNSFTLTESQLKGRDFSRSIYVSANIKKGEVISKENIKIVRPGFSLHPQYYDQILGKIIKKDLKLGDRLKLDDIEF